MTALAVVPRAVTILDPGSRTLDEIADSIRSHDRTLTEARFAIGRDLIEARAQFLGDREFGVWFQGQGFDFARHWARTLRLAAEHEPAVRAALESQLTSGKAANIEKAVAAVLHPEPPAIQMIAPRAGVPAGYRELTAACEAVALLSVTADWKMAADSSLLTMLPTSN